jgi:Mg-chelatase subunit ChlD
LKGKNLENARQLVRRVVEALLKQIQPPLLQALRGAARSAEKTNRPRLRDIDWHRTIRLNLKNYQPDLGRIVPDRLVGAQRRNRGLDRVILCVDSSASMAISLIYAAVYATVLARVPSLTTHLLLFDTAVADLTRELQADDPTDLLFQVQLGGGTHIAGALEESARRVTEPEKTLLVLISDLREGGDDAAFIRRCAQLRDRGVRLVVLPALSNQGKPAYHTQNAQSLADLGIPTFACTPEYFPSLMAQALQGKVPSPER